MDNSHDNLDRLIDGALAGYSNAEPLAGLEGRVLNRVRVKLAMRRRVFAWAVAFAAVASVVVVGIVIRTERHVAVPKPAEIVQAKPALPTAVTRLPRVMPKRVSVKRSGRPKPLPKLEQFPSPAPLTAEERALVALAQQDPEELGKFAEMERQSEAPLEIQPIQIAPLQQDGDQ